MMLKHSQVVYSRLWLLLCFSLLLLLDKMSRSGIELEK